MIKKYVLGEVPPQTCLLPCVLQGPDVVLPYAEMNPANFFVVQCEWATTGEHWQHAPSATLTSSLFHTSRCPTLSP